MKRRRVVAIAVVVAAGFLTHVCVFVWNVGPPSLPPPYATEESKYTKESDTVKLIHKYKENVEKELSDICDRILKLLKDHLEETSATGDSKVFYKKMKGDYYRYLAEFKGGEARKNAAEETLLAGRASVSSHHRTT